MRMPNKSAAKQPLTLKQTSPAIVDTSRTGVTQPAAWSGEIDGDIHAKIAEAAYHRAAQRGFEPGHELDDWLSAETEVTGCSLQRTSVVVDES